MSGDWFEEAINELEETEADVETADSAVETLREDAADEESPDQTQDTAAAPDELDAERTNQSDAGEGETEPDPFGFDRADTDQPEADPSGFNGDDSNEEATKATSSQSSGEFDADTANGEEVGFGNGQSADGSSADDTTPDEGPPTQPNSSMAQSAAEFGFSLEETDSQPRPEPSGASRPDADSPASPPPQQEPPEPTDEAPDDDPFGFGSGGGSTPTMDSGGDDDFGFGGFGGGGTSSPPDPEEFDQEEFESEIDRIDLGIDGLDDMILGGVPERSLIGIIGGAGTGKTTFGLQFLNQALKQGERAVFITLEQTEEAVLSTAEEKGWPFRQYVEDDMLAIVVLDPVEMANSLASIRGDISRLIREFGASRLVLDSVSLLEMMYDHPAKRRSEVFDFTRSLKDAGVTTLLTSEASEDSSHASRYGAVEYLTDAVFVLRYVRTSNFEETRLAIEIQKIRDANHSRATKPYDLTDTGMSVHKQANIF